MKRYFVVHLTESDWKARNLHVDTGRFEIQLLDDIGRARSTYYSQGLSSRHDEVPEAVLAIAHQQPPGQGVYINENGDSIQPF